MYISLSTVGHVDCGKTPPGPPLNIQVFGEQGGKIPGSTFSKRQESAFQNMAFLRQQ
jgi:hypothetical protein